MQGTRYAILGMLSVEPMSGYDIKKAFDESIASFWSENFGHIYPTLRRLREDGLIAQLPSESRRKVYSLTESGREALVAWLHEPPRVQPPRNELILQLFFGKLVSDEVLRAKIVAEQVRQESVKAVYATIREALDAAHDDPRRREWLLALRYGELRTQAILDWCAECLERIG